uniref:Uncharacterized protein n=1 Tax=Ditylenchus dipsaci TaxID=166011 RepID=A0A915DV66_9BILA
MEFVIFSTVLRSSHYTVLLTDYSATIHNFNAVNQTPPNYREHLKIPLTIHYSMRLLDFQVLMYQPCKNLTKCRPLPVFLQYNLISASSPRSKFADERSKSPAGLLVRTWVSL